MKISIVAGGSRGDVQPYVALGGGLQRAGYDVRVLTTDDFEGLVTGAGLQFCSTGKSVEAILQSDEWRKTTERGNFLVILSHMQKEVKKQAEHLAKTLPPLLEGTDLIITGAGGMGGTFSIAQKLNIPVIQAYVFPFSPTREFASPLTPTLPLGQLLNRFSFHATRQMIWQTTRTADVATRKTLNMPKGSFFGHFRRMNREKVPTLYGYSNHVLPRPSDWEAHIDVTGYWYLDT
ncbi:MAG: glycosyltransferase, partial [bacterium]|nr:glycosyltransferase [bacterium]